MCIAALGKQIDDVRNNVRPSMSRTWKNLTSITHTCRSSNDLDVFDFSIKTTNKMCDDKLGLFKSPAVMTGGPSTPLGEWTTQGI